jgi:hypothetical protein
MDSAPPEKFRANAGLGRGDKNGPGKAMGKNGLASKAIDLLINKHWVISSKTKGFPVS